MKRIGVTQRVDYVQRRDEYLEGLDPRWHELFRQFSDHLHIPLASACGDYDRYFEDLMLDAFILTGGNDIGSYRPRDLLEESILDYAKIKHVPVFGVCRGLQFMNHYHGGKLVRVAGHVGSRHRVEVNGGMLSQVREVNSYHDWGIQPDGVGEGLEPIAISHDGTIEGVKHRTLPWMAIMWHPEREKSILQDDLDLMNICFGGFL